MVLLASFEHSLWILHGNSLHKRRGAKHLSKWVADPQPHRRSDKICTSCQRGGIPSTQNGTIVNIATRIVLGDEIEILKILEQSKRSNTISTSFVESRNGSFGKMIKD